MSEKAPVVPDGRIMKKDEAVLLLRQAMDRIEYEPKNHGGRGWQCGGAYWRLAQVLEYYLFQELESQEGKKHSAFIIENHGRISRNFNPVSKCISCEYWIDELASRSDENVLGICGHSKIKEKLGLYKDPESGNLEYIDEPVASEGGFGCNMWEPVTKVKK
ncbi:hypothetical protein [Methylomagnum ishizawai]|uniref:hypothetical protein n=1 Tax=Methylomagnum ishizawai TaxID=1760988 RepID=UPI001C31FC76|nr:hypothetical protein [Methylomagnum ishizawai]BBL74184.1 hypothetical protein MishRS11D_12820 [Methylomagnum ishizawai]